MGTSQSVFGVRFTRSLQHMLYLPLIASKTSTYLSFVEVPVHMPLVESIAPVLYLVVMYEFNAHSVGESALGLRGGYEVLVLKIYFQVLTAVGLD